MNKEIQRIKVNKSVLNTFSYLKGNYSEEDFLVSSSKESAYEIQNTNLNIDFNKSLDNKEIEEICGKINSGVSKEILEDLYSGKFINAEFQEESNLKVINTMDSNLSSTVFNISSKKENSHLYFYSEVTGNEGQFNHLYNLNLSNRSNLTLVIFTDSKSKGFINVLGNCSEDSHIKIVFVNVNKNSVYTNCKVYLEGKKSSSDIDVCYVCSGESKFDFNITSAMLGEESLSSINGKGILLDKAVKVFRGTVDFQKGCLNAKGVENEEVIILSKNVKNQSLPLLLCKEKNVNGSHGFSANSIDKEKIFYLESRGFNEREAKALILRGKFLNLLHEVKQQEIVDRFMNILMEAI